MQGEALHSSLISFSRSSLRLVAVLALTFVAACSAPVPPFQTLWATTECAAPCDGYDLRIVSDTYDFGYAGHKRRFAGHIAGLHMLAQSMLQKASQAASAEAPGPLLLDSLGAHPIAISATVGADLRSYTLVPSDKTARLGAEAFEALVRRIVEDVGPQERATRRRLENYGNLESVSLQQDPFLSCLGARFTFRPSVDGTVLIENEHHVALPAALFVRVVAILREENAAWLDEDYPIRGVDTPSVRLILRYKTFEYTVDAPDRMTWPWPLSDIVARIDEVVVEGSGDVSIKKCLVNRPSRYL
jgi:hypothetical protein